MRTIPRNHTKQITALKASLNRCFSYTLSGYFIAQPCDPAYAWEALSKFSGKLTDNGDGKYTIHLHANHWYELSTGEATS